jgi:hypothetical protein
MQYIHSPKAVVIAGAPASGKSTVARTICDQFDYAFLRLDSINAQVVATLGIDVEELRQPLPAICREYKALFLAELRRLRYRNIVLEGCRISHPHIFQAFHSALLDCYGEYVMLKCFYLNPDLETRKKLYLLRQAQLAKKAVKDKNKNALNLLAGEQKKGFCDFLEPPLRGFEVVEEQDSIIAHVAATVGAKHPNLPSGHETLLQDIAESGTFNPFYQRVEVGGELLVTGFTDSVKTWNNLLRLGIDFDSKKTCDIGCMHGYFTFKMEEAGAEPLGIDIAEGAIRCARLIAEARGSHARFAVLDSAEGFGEEFDVILALNVLHRVADFPAVCRNLFSAARELVVEIGETQLKEFLSLGREHGFRVCQSSKSHRCSDVVGQRTILHLAREAR